MSYSPKIAAMIYERDYTIYYTDGKGNPQKDYGKLISADQDGFVVLKDNNGKIILIPRDRIDSLKEGER
jgi:hypothetical protein